MPDQYRNTIEFMLNDRTVEISALSPRQTLLDWLRLEKRLTGSKEGCAEGDCGACTVLVGRLVEGRLLYESVNACIRFVGSLHATHVVTIEHLKALDGSLHPVQKAMVDMHGSQCGFCTPGFVMSLYGLWLSEDNPSRERIEQALQGNLCRCTGYEPIVKAAEAVAALRPTSVFDPIEKTRVAVEAYLRGLSGGPSVHVHHEGLDLYVPTHPGDIAELMARHPQATIVAGSTDVGLWVTKQMRPINPVIFIGGVEGLQKIAASEAGMTIGAGVTYSQALARLAASYPALGKLLPRIGGEQVRNMGTIGGNIANGSPIGDTPPALIALGAELTLRSREGARSMLLEDFFIDYGKQDRQRHEFVESVFIPKLAADAHFAVYKLSKRRDEDITAVLGAFYLRLDAQGRVNEIRLAYGGMAGTPKRAAAVEAALVGQVWNEANVRSAAEKLGDDFSPLTDWRATAEYRMLTARNLLTRFYLESQGETAELKRFAEGAR
ncbi:xanthine dehydrogenase small subunit [Rhizobium alvei]|uniref:Xanthine dehydrogenase small subunit n=1 Tax=Rhizobium alvei TaxID=1132659 RepID=A0ABT8YL59_9HYPH|nr:xanthine dehydrogenase small subunit [Rhizobium alvei]MDO6964319.1 xanthine dehydrogenase small subunit [Rhizobium alvei]